MERRGGGCCIARYGGDADVAWKMGRIMLRFRPIAPKPEFGTPVSGGADVAGGRRVESKRRGGGGGGRGRGRRARRVAEAAVGVKGRQGDQEKSSASPSLSSSSSSAPGSGSSGESSIVTLPLMPEMPERSVEEEKPKEATAAGGALSSILPPYEPLPWWMREGEGTGGGGEVVAPRPLRPAGSWVTLERVTETWRQGEVAGDDAAVLAALRGDTCPGFVSDQWDRVTWTNQEYRKMVLGPSSPEATGKRSLEEEEEEEEEEDVRVALVTKGMVPPEGTCRAFTCRVRVLYAFRRRGRGSLAAPCDVWRLDGGGFAWRLDVKAALSLSLGS